MLYAKIKKDFGDFFLDIEFETKKETLALFGASGCGKSMTLKCIAGIVKPDEGEIVLNNKILYNSKKNINLLSRNRNVGLLFQSYAIFPNMTLRENLKIALPKKQKNKDFLINEKINAFSLNGLENNYPHQLSGGQQQRVALARMLLNEPDILMLDEPFSALDEHLRWQMEQELSLILKENQGSTLYVSHNKDEVYRLCDKIAVLNNGKIAEINTKEELFTNPTTLNSAILTGCKNISRAEKINDNKLLAIDWGIELNCEKQVERNITHVGIHTHNILLSENKDCENTFKFNIIDNIKSLSKDTIVLSNIEKNINDTNSYIYLDFPKESLSEMKANNTVYLKFSKEDLLLLN